MVAAHDAVRIGGYGNMIQPVSACATGRRLPEEGVDDKIALGKASDFVSPVHRRHRRESVIGFGNMNATANPGGNAR